MVCIIGAGPAGLSAARALKRLGIAYQQFERHSDVGGIWDITNPGTPMYHSAHFISSRKMSGFYDFPMPEHYPDYPTNQQILAYTRSFAREFGLYDDITFNTGVELVEKDGTGWMVRLSNGETKRFRAVICSTGTNWYPKLPRHSGNFNGEIRHSVTFKHAEEFRGKRVLIVGLGNSGADIACDAAANADAAFVSVRRGYHFIPKHIFGIPADEFAQGGPQLPIWAERPAMSLLLRMMVGDVSRTGLPKPDHKLFESHPLMNTQLLHYLQHGDIKAKGDVDHFEGDEVVFKDGSRERIDLVLYATGYDMRIPYVPAHYFTWSGGRPQLYLTAFNRQHRNLFTIGYLETNSSAYTLFDHIAQMVANYLHDQQYRPAHATVFDHAIQHDQPSLTGGIKFIDSDRHKAYIEIAAYKRYIEQLRKRQDWPAFAPGFFDAIRLHVTKSSLVATPTTVQA
jgi:hypothetical protein